MLPREPPMGMPFSAHASHLPKVATFNKMPRMYLRHGSLCMLLLLMALPLLAVTLDWLQRRRFIVHTAALPVEKTHFLLTRIKFAPIKRIT